jgi:hypothetical protein
VTAPAVAFQPSVPRTAGLCSRKWDLTFISLSVVLAGAPYAAYLGLSALQPVLQPIAGHSGADLDTACLDHVLFMRPQLVEG